MALKQTGERPIVRSPQYMVTLTWSDLLASDWELVEKPDPPPPTWTQLHDANAEIKHLEGQTESYGATISRLERELSEANDYAVDFKRTVERLHRELDASRVELAEAKLANGPGLTAIRKLRRIREYVTSDAWVENLALMDTVEGPR